MGQCRFYSWNRGDNDCFKLDRRVKSSVADRFCNSWNYTECPVFNSYNSGYDLRSEYESFIYDSSSGCFLTTACVEARQAPDDCFELTTLRTFRDSWVKENHPCDIPFYYAVAPRIVKKINALPEAHDIWSNLYNELVEPCVKLIVCGESEEAYNLYKKKTLNLQKKYLE